MRKKAAALLLCALLIFQMAVPPAEAEDYVYFVATGEKILPLSDDKMPFWNGGYLYIASSIFTGAARDAVDIGNIHNKANKQVILYSGGKSLWFEYEKNRVYDLDGNSYYPGAVYRKGEVYVPISVVARYFGLQYSVINVRSVVNGEVVRGDLAWIRQPGYILTDKDFVDAASYSSATCYENYLKEREEQASSGISDLPNGAEIEGKRSYLCMTGGESTAELLDVLDRYGEQAAFFCTPEFLEEQGDLLRRMTATGQAIGILADAGDETRSVLEQLEAGNRALALATCGKTRLVRIENGDEQTIQAVEAAGYRCMEPDLDRSGYDLKSMSNASNLLSRISSRRGDVTVWLADRVDAVGLRAFLNAATHGDIRCLAWTETA